MKAEDNILDNWLKKSLWRDIAYKIGVWGVISAISFYIAQKSAGFDIGEYLLGFMGKSMPQLNYVWMVLLFCIVLSCFMKDMEAMKPDRWGVHTLRGNAGAIFRKVTADMLLWSGGISTALLTTSIISITLLFHKEPHITYKSIMQVSYILMVLIVFLSANIGCYFILKRDKAVLFSVLNCRMGIKILYSVIFLFSLYITHTISGDIDKKQSLASHSKRYLKGPAAHQKDQSLPRTIARPGDNFHNATMAQLSGWQRLSVRTRQYAQSLNGSPRGLVAGDR